MITCRPRLLEIFSSCARTSPTMTRDTSRGSASGSSSWVLLHSEWSVACQPPSLSVGWPPTRSTRRREPNSFQKVPMTAALIISRRISNRPTSSSYVALRIVSLLAKASSPPPGSPGLPPRSPVHSMHTRSAVGRRRCLRVKATALMLLRQVRHSKKWLASGSKSCSSSEDTPSPSSAALRAALSDPSSLPPSSSFRFAFAALACSRRPSRMTLPLMTVLYRSRHSLPVRAMVPPPPPRPLRVAISFSAREAHALGPSAAMCARRW